MTDEATLELIDQRVHAAISGLTEELPNAIAAGIATHAARPPGEKGSPSMQFGVVEDTFPDDGYSMVTLDGQINPTAVSMLGPLTIGERVAVLFYPPSGTLAIGQVSPVGIPGVSISNLPPAGTLTGTEEVPIDQSGTTVRTTTQDIANLATGGGGSGFPVGPFDDGNATHEIEARLLGGVLSEMSLTVTDDTNAGAIAGIGLLNGLTGGEVGIQAVAVASDGSQGQVIVGAIATSDASSALTAQAAGATEASVSANSSVSTGKSLVQLEADGIVVGTTTGTDLGFYGATPVAQQAHPTLITDVITILTNLGLCAP